MNNKIILKIFCFIFLLLSLNCIFAALSPPEYVFHENELRQLFKIYEEKSSEEKTVFLNYLVDEFGNIKNKKTSYKDIIIGDITGYSIKINNNSSNNLKTSAEFENVYFLKLDALNNSNQKGVTELIDYYNSLPFDKFYNYNNKDIVVNDLLLPITKDSLITHLKLKKINAPENLLNKLLAEKIIVEMPILLTVDLEILVDNETKFTENKKLSIDFYPEFLNPIKPINFQIDFKKEPLKISSVYSVPHEDCKTNLNAAFCYITVKDIENFNYPKYTSIDATKTEGALLNLLDNFYIVSNFKSMVFENINVKPLLVELTGNRKNFCFREENESFNKVIFDVAKSYDLSLEQTFQLWAIISERSNCNYYTKNKNVYGFVQLNLNNRDIGNLINIEDNTLINSVSIAEKSTAKYSPECEKCGEGFFISKNYPTSYTIGKETYKKGELCYSNIKEPNQIIRCIPKTGILAGKVGVGDVKNALDKELTALYNSSTSLAIKKAEQNLPLQIAEEEIIQYLSLGNYENINEYLYDTVYNKDSTKFYKIGNDGKINDTYNYFTFLVNAIKNNRDNYGSTILFTADYLKELNYLVKNSKTLSTRPFIFNNFISVNNENINSVYVLASIFNIDEFNKKDIYLQGYYPNSFSVDSFFLKENNYIKTTKEIRVLINYLTIKRKYLEDKSYFDRYNIRDAANQDLINKIELYDSLDAEYWITKRNKYLDTLEKNNWSLMIKNKEHNNYEELLKIEGKPNYPLEYTLNLGQNIYLNGKNNYPIIKGHAWSFDTRKEAIENYNLIWEAADICLNKKPCNNKTTNATECCKENKAVQDGSVIFPYSDVLIDGAILGIYNPNSKYNDENREYTHLAISIGKTISGVPLIAETVSFGQTISVLNEDVKKRIKRVYVPKNTNIHNMADIHNNKGNFPTTYMHLSLKDTSSLTEAEQNKTKATENYYEDPKAIGEGDFYQLQEINGKCSIYVQDTLDKYIDCLKNQLNEIVTLSKKYVIDTIDNGVVIRGSGLGSNLINVKYKENYCFTNNASKEYTEVIFEVAKRLELTEEETAQLWSKIAAESGCKLKCSGTCHGDGIGQVTRTWRTTGQYNKLKKYLIPIDSEKYKDATAFLSAVRVQDDNPTTGTEFSYVVSKYIIDELIRLSKNSKKPFLPETFSIYDSDDAIKGMFVVSYNYCSTSPSNFKNGLTPISYFSGCVYTSLHKLGYYLAYKKEIYNCQNHNTTNHFIASYKNIYGGTLCD